MTDFIDIIYRTFNDTVKVSIFSKLKTNNPIILRVTSSPFSTFAIVPEFAFGIAFGIAPPICILCGGIQLLYFIHFIVASATPCKIGPTIFAMAVDILDVEKDKKQEEDGEEYIKGGNTKKIKLI